MHPCGGRLSETYWAAHAWASHIWMVMCVKNAFWSMLKCASVHCLQASTNTVLAHFASIVFANWLLRLLQRSQQKAATA